MNEDLTWLPAWKIAALVASRAVSPVEVTRHFLEKIEKLDPSLHAFAYLDAEGALQQAERAEDDINSGREIGPLHGVPFGVMDLTPVEGIPAAAWSEPSKWDSVPVARMREAGAILFGTLATYFFDPEKRPLNPWDTSRDTGNSSRGSASAVAAGMLPISLAEDGAGSTRLPAAWNGVLGLHTSRGLIPRIDFANPVVVQTQSLGPIARDARDCAIVTQVLAGPDGRDLTVTQQEPRNYAAELQVGVSGLRFAWTDDFGWASVHQEEETPSVIEKARNAAFSMSALGATVRTTSATWEDSNPALGTLGRIVVDTGFIVPVGPSEAVEREAKLDEALGLEPASQAPLPDMPSPTAAEYQEATLLRERIWKTTVEVLEENDIILSATTPILPKSLEEWGLSGRARLLGSYTAYTAMFNLLGFPALSVPCGFVNGLPVGLQMATRPGREDLLFRAAHAFLEANPQEARPSSAI